MKTNLELYRRVMVVTGGHRRLPGGSDDFSLQTNTHCIIIYLSPQTPSSRSPSLPSLNSKIWAKLHPRRQQTPFTFLARGCQVQPSDEDEKSLGNSLKDSKILRTRNCLKDGNIRYVPTLVVPFLLLRMTFEHWGAYYYFWVA